jgi:hypothetical protein
MTVVAGCALLDGALLAADTRVTVINSGKSDRHLDVAQKLFPLPPHAAIGYSGDVRLANRMLGALYAQFPTRCRHDPISLVNWIPRLFRFVLASQATELRRSRIVFLVAVSLANRPAVVSRRLAEKLMNEIGFGQPAIQFNSIPDWLVRVLQTPPEVEWVAVPGASHSCIFLFESPGFTPRYFPPLQVVVVGSGQPIERTIDSYSTAIFAGPGGDFAESTFLRSAVHDHLLKEEIVSVGGAVPVLKVNSAGVQALGQTVEYSDGTKLSIRIEGGRWVQRNHTSGTEVRLLHPSEIDPSMKGDRFDDWNDALRRFRGNGPQTGS